MIGTRPKQRERQDTSERKKLEKKLRPRESLRKERRDEIWGCGMGEVRGLSECGESVLERRDVDRVSL